MRPDADDATEAGRVIVVGAGAAGLTAARLLQRHGREVVVVEARDRIGGRTSTVDVGGALVDEGAAWIDGPKGNPLMPLAEEAGLTTMSADYVDPLRVAAYDPERGRWLGRFEALRHVIGLARIGQKLAAPDTSGSATLAERIDRASPKRERIRRFLVRTFVQSNWADAADLLGPHAAEMGASYAGGELVIAGGYGELVSFLGSGLDIRTGHVVEAVHYGDSGVEVQTSLDTFEGSHVIVTVPLGVLKAGSIVFDPALPNDKQAAIDAIGVGRLEKVVLRFPEPFWRIQPGRPRNLVYLGEGAACPMFFDLSEGGGEPFLVALVTGAPGTRLVAEPDAVIAEALQALEEMFPGRVPAPIATHTTRWQDDSFALGSYSTIRPGTARSHFDDLAAPVGSRLLFAGEATDARRAGYVDGAIDSGVREASRILDRDVTL